MREGGLGPLHGGREGVELQAWRWRIQQGQGQFMSSSAARCVHSLGAETQCEAVACARRACLPGQSQTNPCRCDPCPIVRDCSTRRGAQHGSLFKGWWRRRIDIGGRSEVSAGGCISREPPLEGSRLSRCVQACAACGGPGNFVLRESRTLSNKKRLGKCSSRAPGSPRRRQSSGRWQLLGTAAAAAWGRLQLLTHSLGGGGEG